jgi:hypothetical protein
MAAENSLVKSPHKQQVFTAHQIEEFGKCADPDTGYLYFLKNYYYIQHPIKGRLLFQPFDYQIGLLEGYHNHLLSVNLMPRQSGKTTSAAGYILWFAMFRSDQSILIAAHKFTGSQEIMQRIRYGYESCPDFIRAGVVSYNKGSIDFDNGSRIISTTTTETTGRGLSISLLYADELAYVMPTIADAMWASISPTLSTGGKAIITSTPNTDEDLFANIWKDACNNTDEYGNQTVLGKNGFYAYRAYWDQHPDRDEAWANRERAKMGDEKFRREFNCEFVTAEETLISPILLSQMEGIVPLRTMGQSRWYKELDKEKIYVVALDPSLGTGGDPAAIQVVELPTFEQVAEWQHNLTPIQGQIKILREILNYIRDNIGAENNNNIYWSIENNSIGEAGLVCINDIGEENFPGLFLSEPAKKGMVKKTRKGFNTTHRTKINAAARLKYLIESRKMKLYSKSLISELKNYIATGVSFKGKGNETDDLVSAMLLIVRISHLLSDWDQRVFDSISTKNELMGEEFEYPMPIYISSYVG